MRRWCSIRRSAGKLLEQAAAAGERSQLSPDRLRVPTLTVLRGRTDQKEYRIAGKLTVIGHSKMATVRLRGWFTPEVAAQINKHEDGYYLGRGDRVPKINGVSIQRPDQAERRRRDRSRPRAAQFSVS